jgi:hypothetical protein
VRAHRLPFGEGIKVEFLVGRMSVVVGQAQAGQRQIRIGAGIADDTVNGCLPTPPTLRRYDLLLEP